VTDSEIANWFSLSKALDMLTLCLVAETEDPSCGYVPSRVLTRLRYDAHWLRQASGVQNRPRGPYTTAKHSLSLTAFYPLIGFSPLQGDRHTNTGWDRRLPRFCPLQRHHRPTCKPSFQTRRILAHRFSQPPGRINVRNDLQVYSTPQALLGFGLQRLSPG